MYTLSSALLEALNVIKLLFVFVFDLQMEKKDKKARRSTLTAQLQLSTRDGKC